VTWPPRGRPAAGRGRAQPGGAAIAPAAPHTVAHARLPRLPLGSCRCATTRPCPMHQLLPQGWPRPGRSRPDSQGVAGWPTPSRCRRGAARQGRRDGGQPLGSAGRQSATARGRPMRPARAPAARAPDAADARDGRLVPRRQRAVVDRGHELLAALEVQREVVEALRAGAGWAAIAGAVGGGGRPLLSAAAGGAAPLPTRAHATTGVRTLRLPTRRQSL
jgi:hypothetical protein